MAVPAGPLRGRTFFLDVPSGWAARELAEVIRHLGGETESFLSKEVSYVVSSKKEAKRSRARARAEKRSSVTSEGAKAQSSTPSSSKENHTRPQQKLPDTALISRGRELLQKAMKNQDTCSGSSILANARLWGVQIVHVDEMLSYAQQLLRAASGARKQRTEAQSPVSGQRAHKAGKLKPPFLKVEDQSRQFRPFHHQFKSFPGLNLLAPKGCSPFEPPKNLPNSCGARAVEGCTEHSKGEKSPQSTAVPKKKRGFCECCQETFEELQKHLQSPQHRCFALDDSRYALVDHVIAQLASSITGQLPRVPLPCLTDEHLMPRAQCAAGAEVLTSVLGEERQQREQAVGLLSADPSPKGCSSCLPGNGVGDPTETEGLSGSRPSGLSAEFRSATAAPSEPHRLLHTPPACRKRPLGPAQPAPLGKKPRVELRADPTGCPVFLKTPQHNSTTAPRDFEMSSESGWDVPLLSTLPQDGRICSVDRDLLQRGDTCVRGSGCDSQLCLVLQQNSESDRSCRNCCAGSRAAFPPISDLLWQLD
ncbi:protein DBF4 homolog B isoform X1 [Centrocercus urophasianus]|uniref:protein DBF4 homolog B isoform X1 n=1 Tax=Centrocercus urophasianus TaxID=9002 RepID=UPI001C650D7D|nr:protein DBF4 homolog B isoform X1 [Centrocercus urophasianus]